MTFCTECGAEVPADVRFCVSCGAPIKSRDFMGRGGATEQTSFLPSGKNEQAQSVTTSGNPMGEAAQPIPVMAAASASTQAAAGVASPTQAIPIKRPTTKSNPVKAAFDSDAPPTPGSKYAIMSTGAYIGTMILFCIPIVGWLACIIMAFAAKNQNKRNFARAMLVFLIVGIVLSVVLYFVFSWAAEDIMQYINEATGDLFGEFGGLGDLFIIMKGAGIPGQ